MASILASLLPTKTLGPLRRMCFIAAGSSSAGFSAAACAAPAAEHFDYLVIGGGSGGVSSARRAAMYGARVAVVERGPDRDASGNRQGGGFGGTCVNMGCVPKKLMVTAAGLMEAAEQAPGYGVSLPHPTVDWATLVAKRDAYVARLNTIYENNLDKDSIHHVRGKATFVGPREVRVGSRILTADHVLVAVGGRPALPSIPGAELWWVGVPWPPCKIHTVCVRGILQEPPLPAPLPTDFLTSNSR